MFGSSLDFLPSKNISPESESAAPRMSLAIVDLPEPDSPAITRTSPL